MVVSVKVCKFIVQTMTDRWKTNDYTQFAVHILEQILKIPFE